MLKIPKLIAVYDLFLMLFKYDLLGYDNVFLDIIKKDQRGPQKFIWPHYKKIVNCLASNLILIIILILYLETKVILQMQRNKRVAILHLASGIVDKTEIEFIIQRKEWDRHENKELLSCLLAL